MLAQKNSGSAGNVAPGAVGTAKPEPPAKLRYERLMSPNELSYFLPSRAYGSNDMHSVLEFYAPTSLINQERLLLAYAIIRLRHIVNASRVVMGPIDDGTLRDQPLKGTSPSDAEKFYRSARYTYDVPESTQVAFKDAKENAVLELDTFHDFTGEDVLYEYNNGPRTLRSNKICVLKVFRIVDSRQPKQSISEPVGKFAILWASAHFALDGLATFAIVNEFFELLGGKTPASFTDGSQGQGPTDVISTPNLAKLLELELQARREHAASVASSVGGNTSSGSWNARYVKDIPPFQEAFPLSVDARVGRFKDEAEAKHARADYEQDEKRFIGAHIFPRKPKSPPPSQNHKFEYPVHRSPAEPPRDHISRHILYSPPQLTAIIKACKKHGVSLQNAMFAACNVAWLRIADKMLTEEQRRSEKEKEKSKWPTLMYTAINLRPFLPKSPSDSGLPGARAAQPLGPSRQPSIGYLGLGYFNTMLPGTLPPSDRIRAEFWERAKNAKNQQNETLKHPMLLHRNVFMGADRAVRSVRFAIEDDGLAPPPAPKPAAPAQQQKPKGPPPPPSAALMGLSLMGSADPTFKTSLYPLIQPLTLRPGTRKGVGGFVLTTFTFRGIFYLSVAWDEVPFEAGMVERFFEEVRTLVVEMFFEDEENGKMGKELMGENPRGVDIRECDELLLKWVGDKPSITKAEKARL